MALVFLVAGALAASEPAARMAWRQLDDLPEAAGLKGMYAGISNGHVILAGGSNFPVPQREGGRKVFHRRMFVRALPLNVDAKWSTTHDVLPTGLGEGASVTTPLGVVCLGGHDGTRPVANAFLLKWDPVARTVERRGLPELPAGIANAAALYVRGWIYLAGGESGEGTLGAWWRLELAAALADPSGARWNALPAWPGRPRFGCILSLVTTRAGERLLVAGGVHGPAKGTADYLRDAWLYESDARTWSRAADLPRGAVLAAAVQPARSTVLVLGGSDGHDFARMKELGERYRIPGDVLAYDALADRWLAAGTMPLGLAGAAVVDLGGRCLVAGGEYSPGLRTAHTYEMQVQAGPEAPAVRRDSP